VHLILRFVGANTWIFATNPIFLHRLDQHFTAMAVTSITVSSDYLWVVAVALAVTVQCWMTVCLRPLDDAFA